MGNMEENAREVAQLLKVLANENRLLILCALLEKPESVGELVKQLRGISQSGVSQHLAVLKSQAVVDCHKNGQTIIYHIADERIKSVMAILKEQYCGLDERKEKSGREKSLQGCTYL